MKQTTIIDQLIETLQDTRKRIDTIDKRLRTEVMSNAKRDKYTLDIEDARDEHIITCNLLARHGIDHRFIA